MSFSFNPLMWFLCGSCQEAFPNTEELKDHKMKQHLSDCLRIKCIVFEEKFVDDAWTPANRVFSSQPSNEPCLPPKRNQPIDQTKSFRNPYVPLTKLPMASSETLSWKRKAKSEQRSRDVSEEFPPLKSQRCISPTNDNKEAQNPKTEIPDQVNIPILIPKEEPKVYDDAESPLLKDTSFSQPLTFGCTSQSTPASNPLHSSDGKLIIPSYTTRSNAPGFEFPSHSYLVRAGHSTSHLEEDPDLGSEFHPAYDSDSSEEPVDCNPLAIASTIYSLDPQPPATFDAEKKEQSNNDFNPKTKPEEESFSEFEPESDSDSGSEWEGDSDLDLDFEPETIKKPSTKNTTKHKINEKRKESSKPFFQCSICFETFPKITSLKNHRMIHRRTKFFKCSNRQCLASFDAKENLAKHKKEHRNQRSIDLDPDFSLDLPLLHWLLLQEEKNPTNLILLEPDPKSCAEFQPVSEANPVTCKLCKESFVSEINLRWHVSKCFLFNKRWHRYCQECDRYFSSAKSFRNHASIQHSTVPRPIFKCSVCSKEFKEKKNFEFHQSTHEPPEEFQNDDDVEEKDVKDRGKKPTYFKCQYCDKSLINASVLRYHERTHTGECPFKCDIGNCDKAFTKKTLLQKHQQSTHMEELGLPGHLCPICGKKYRDKHSLRQHMDYNHDDSKLLKCTFDDTCSHVCKNKAQLTEHIRTVHTGEKPFQCDQCGDGFSRKRTLVRHIKRTHEGFRFAKVSCSLCPRKLKGNYELKKHMETHEGGKSFECKVCGYLTASLSYLTRHEKSHGKGAATESKSKGSVNDPDGDDILTDLLCL